MIVVSDTSPISSLLVIEELRLLQNLYGTIIIPAKVFEELERLEEFEVDIQPIRTADWVLVKEPSSKDVVRKLEEELDSGEAAAISLALELEADYLFIDEKRGRAVANEMGIPIIGVLGILMEAKQVGLIPALKPLLDRLISEAGFYLADSLYQYILRKASENT